MTKSEAKKLLMEGRYSEWNSYRNNNPNWIPDLSGLEFPNSLYYTGKGEPDLSKAILIDTYFSSNSNIQKCLFFKGGLDLQDALISPNTRFPSRFDPIKSGAKIMSKAEFQKINKNQPTIFISYAWADEKLVRAVDFWLQQKNLKTKIDQRDFFGGARIMDEIMRVMQTCDVIIIFYSSKSKNKPWPDFEREFAADIEMEAKKSGNAPPRIIYLAIDDTELPTLREKNRLAIKAKGKRFELVCEELYHYILQLPRKTKPVDLTKWEDYTF